MNIRIIQWNISMKCKGKKIADCLSRYIHGPTIITLQEVSKSTYAQIASVLTPPGIAYSLDLRKAGNHEGRNRKMGVATFVFDGRISHYELVSRSIFPERTLFSTSQFEGKNISLLNFHSLTGVDYKKAKSSNFASLADFIDEHSSCLDFFTCDANEPQVDALEDDKIEFWDNRDKGHNAGLLLGKNKVHSLCDAYKVHINNNNPGIRTNPLAFSHKTGGNLRRYDFIYCSSDWKVHHVEYPYEESVNASSDHSMVIGEFSLDPNTKL